MLEKYSVFKEKVFIDIHTGNKLGYISDLEIDLSNGRICRIFLSKDKGFCSLLCFCGKKEKEVIEWRDIKKVGDEAVLVDKRDFRKPHFENRGLL